MPPRQEFIEEPVTHQVKVLDPEPSFDLAAMAASSWVKAHITAIYEVNWDDLVVTLLQKPEFEATARARSGKQ